MAMGNQSSLMYDGGTVEFRDGRAMNIDPTFAERFVSRSERKQRARLSAQTLKDKIRNLTKKIPTKKQEPRNLVLQDVAGNPIDHRQLTVPGKITVVDFYATWCGPCRQIAPILDSMAAHDPDVILKKVNIHNWDSKITRQFNVSSVPNIRVFDRKGRLVAPPTSNPNAVQQNIDLAKKQ
jgi:thioredoxin 1